MDNFTEENNDTERFRIRGQKTSIRFFNHDNEEDIRRLLKIVQDKKVREWVEGIEDMDFDDVKEWAGQKGQNIGDDCLFAIVGSREYVANNEIGEVQGFVNTYEMPMVAMIIMLITIPKATPLEIVLGKIWRAPRIISAPERYAYTRIRIRTTIRIALAVFRNLFISINTSLLS
ncbi:MAG: hypothetical protein UW29_C0008G0001, partial [Candidatus Collierbacteria bacterium GW2011_GWC2_44_13]